MLSHKYCLRKSNVVSQILSHEVTNVVSQILSQEVTNVVSQILSQEVTNVVSQMLSQEVTNAVLLRMTKNRKACPYIIISSYNYQRNRGSYTSGHFVEPSASFINFI